MLIGLYTVLFFILSWKGLTEKRGIIFFEILIIVYKQNEVGIYKGFKRIKNDISNLIMNLQKVSNESNKFHPE